MSQICLYFDEDSADKLLLQALLHRGVDVLTVQNTEREGYSDREQLLWATSQGRVLYSSNIKDFYHLHTLFLTQGKSHAGLILVQQQRYSVGQLMRGILSLIGRKSAEEMRNKVEFLSSWINDTP